MNYWRVKAAALERQVRLAQLQVQADEANAAFEHVMMANGLDPKKNYELNDAEETVTEIPPKD